MKFLPYDSFTIETSDPLPKVVERLQMYVTAPPFFATFRDPSAASYYGTVNEHSFKIFPRIHYRNSFLPIICGTLREEKAGAIIDVYMRLHLAIAVFLALVVAFVGTIFVFAYLTVFIDGRGSVAIFVVPSALLIAFAAMTCGGFWFEARHVQRHLTGILTGMQSKPRPIHNGD